MDAPTLKLAKKYHDEHSGSGLNAVISWKGQSTPDVTKIPAGITVTYSGTTYTGTLAADATTVGNLYFVYDTEGSSPNIYKEYMTIKDDTTYSWECLGTTEVNLDDYPTFSDVATTSKNGTMSSTDKVKLNGIQTGAITLTERVSGQSYSSGTFTYVKES